MGITIGSSNRDLKFVLAEDEWPGVIRIAKIVAGDIRLVTGVKPQVVTCGGSDGVFEGVLSGNGENCELNPGVIYAGTLGHSALMDRLAGEGVLAANKIQGKREVYSFMITEGGALVIAGSDKRGTIYGLFHISEILGVSPWVWFADVVPEKKDNIEITSDMCHISREPSVEYRGIFINDEWPSFGNWTFEHFDGFTSEMYEHVFELILRLKGNYLWPAMWTSNFSLDGPGFSNAELADEMGIVMSNSHHEPCLRHSEEWDLVKGDDTPYGKDWNFDKNREGLTNYWRDGLKRNGHLENIVTMGMRGERDSEVLGREATLKENIDYIKDVVETQNRLIKETIDDDLDKVPRMIAIYKEVEKYYNGDENTPGLRVWDGLDGITCMLCEDNFGNMRGLPAKEEKARKGGFGMYYHFDYHGDPISYEWINSTTLPKTWEQMCEAYESGVRKIWIVNTGDIFTNEYPLSYFMDLAYDYEKWGVNNTKSPSEYLEKWVLQQFGDKNADRIRDILDTYTYINLRRKPEALNADTYHPFNYGECSGMLKMCSKLFHDTEELEAEYEDTPLYDAFEELVGFPARATANINYMQLCAGRNKAYALSGRPQANIYGYRVEMALLRDAALTDFYHELADGKWNGLMLSEHIGFTHWNDEEAMYPVVMNVCGSGKPRMIVSRVEGDKWTAGGDWTRKTIYVTDFLDPSAESASIMIENAGLGDFHWEAKADRDWITLSESGGFLPQASAAPSTEDDDMWYMPADPIEGEESVCCLNISADLKRSGIPEGGTDTATVVIESGFAKVYIKVPVINYSEEEINAAAKKRFVPVILQDMMDAEPEYLCPEYRENALGAVINADEYDGVFKAGGNSYVCLPDYGKYRHAIKAYPVDRHFDINDAGNPMGKTVPPSVSYYFYAHEATDVEITLITAPSNPIDGTDHLNVGVSFNNTAPITVSCVSPGYRGGERDCPEWAKGVLDQEHRTVITRHANKGENSIAVYAMDPGVVLERILIRQAGTSWAKGYTGPA